VSYGAGGMGNMLPAEPASSSEDGSNVEEEDHQSALEVPSWGRVGTFYVAEIFGNEDEDYLSHFSAVQPLWWSFL
jgi:hypothetical protein